METGTLNLSFERSPDKCRITIENHIISRLPRETFSGASSIAIVSDDIVSKLYAAKVKYRLSRFAKTEVITIKHGEKNKNINTSSEIAAKMNNLGLDRKSIVVALGGGVVGDMVGFVSSIFKRGVKYVQMPTSLLAQVDSSIGGKTGVDTNWGKNQIGSFYQPVAIFIDPSVLDTLPDVEVVNGLGEMIKSGIIADKKLFQSIERIDSPTIQDLKQLITPAVNVKAGVVEADERETSLRSILNYGHTVGHAIEAASEFMLSHGKCVILGMVAEGWIAAQLGIFNESDLERQNALLRSIIKRSITAGKLDTRRILGFAIRDKKSTGSTIKMALPERIGRMHKTSDGNYLVTVSQKLFTDSLQELLSDI